MERMTFSVLFYIRRTKLNRNGEAPVMMRITVNSVRADVAIKRSIPPELWNSEKGKAIEKRRECKELNLYLDTVRMRVMKIQRDMEIEGITVTAPMLLDRYLGRGAFVDRSLFDVFREHNEQCKKLEGISMAHATVQRYETSLQHTRDFVWDMYHKKDFF